MLNLGIQSYCFRTFTEHADLVRAMKQADLSYIELCSRHLHYDWPVQEQEKGQRYLKENGIIINGYGQVRFTVDEQHARRVFELANRISLKAITANVDPEAYKLMDALTEEYGINLAIHNHGKNHRYGTFALLDEAFSKTSNRQGLCLDSGWFIDAGEDPIEAVCRYRDRLYGVHLKDFAYSADGKREDVIIGTGRLDLFALLKALADEGFEGYMSIEYEGEEENPVPSTVKCVDAVRHELTRIEGGYNEI